MRLWTERTTIPGATAMISFSGLTLHLEHDAVFRGDVLLLAEDEQGSLHRLGRFWSDDHGQRRFEALQNKAVLLTEQP